MSAAPAAVRRRTAAPRVPAAAGAVPYLAVVAVFLVLPVAVTVWTAAHDRDGRWSLGAFTRLAEAQYASAFATTAALSALTAVLGGAGGLVLAWALATAPTGPGSRRLRWLRSAVLSYCGVASQLGGVPLAFAFVAALGAQGLVTTALRAAGAGDLSALLPLGSFGGLALVYLYFQVPLMAVLVLPAVLGLRREWREAAASLGAGPVRYARDVALPVLAPAVGGAVLLLFANAFGAYATAFALTGGGANLVAVQVGYFVSGNVLVDPSFGAALVTGMVAVVAAAVVARGLLVRRSARWLR